MHILIVGGTGTIGKAVVAELSKRHQVTTAGFKNGDIQVDIADPKSIEAMYEKIGAVDAVIATTGKATFAPLNKMTEAAYRVGIDHKLMGQVNLVLIGLNYINDAGSFTLTSGILNRDPIVQGSGAALVNGALDGFVKSAAIEMPRGIRLNVVSPTVIEEAMEKYATFFPGFRPVKASMAALAYAKSVEGRQTGRAYCVDL